MKKKLLSLVLAGAMVATTSVSAFAADTVNHAETSIEEGKESKDVEIGITGNILDDQGNKVPGTISVTVPTTTTFSVNATDGTLTSPEMTITNNGDENIKVTASKFEDANGTEKINIVKKTVFEEQNHTPSDNDRGTVWLRLTGGSQNLGLTSEGNGKMYDSEYANEKQETDNYEIGRVTANGGTMKLKLEGKGGISPTDRNPVDTAIQDEFKLVLKISRAK